MYDLMVERIEEDCLGVGGLIRVLNSIATVGMRIFESSCEV